MRFLPAQAQKKIVAEKVSGGHALRYHRAGRPNHMRHCPSPCKERRQLTILHVSFPEKSARKQAGDEQRSLACLSNHHYLGSIN
jgi:hypothetical protein